MLRSKSLYRNVIAFLPALLLLAGCAPSSQHSMWQCTATDARQAMWVQYSPTRVEAATLVRDRCRAGSYRPTCVVRCIPPTVRWHCVAIDRDGHTWYWNSVNRNIAIRNARNACKQNSSQGGCSVPVGNCSMT